MERFVLNIFKAIMFSMIFIFAFDIGSYLYRAFSLDQKMNNIMTSLQRVVMENNYLPQEAYEEYAGLFQMLKDDYNGVDATANVNGSQYQDRFIEGFDMNFNDDLKVNGAVNLDNYFDSGILVKKMDTPADYGDIMAVQVAVQIYQPIWGFDFNKLDTQNEYSSVNMNRVYRTHWMAYTYYVPCLHYQRVD